MGIKGAFSKLVGKKSEEKKAEEAKSKTNWYSITVTPELPSIKSSEYEQAVAKLTAGKEGMARYLALDEARKPTYDNGRFTCTKGFTYAILGRLDVEASSIENAKSKIIAASKEKFSEKDEKSKIETVLGFKFGNLEEVLKSIRE